jgi:hypothetical protein
VVGDSSVGRIVPLGGSDSAGSDSILSLYSRDPRVVLVDVNHKVCDTHQVCATCATVRHGAPRAPRAPRCATSSFLSTINNQE